MNVPTSERERVIAVLAVLMPRWNPSAVTSLARLPGGYANDNYTFDHGGDGYVLRIVRDGLPGAIPRALEHDLLTGSLAPLAPEVVAYGVPEGHLLTRRIDAPLLADVGATVADLADYLAALHRRLPRAPCSYAVDALIRQWLALAGAVHGAAARARLALLDALPAVDAQIACHNDLNPWNVIALGAPSTWRTLDWEWFGTNSRWFDAIGLARGLSLDDGAETELIARYGRAVAVAIPTTRVRRADTLRYHLREWAWAVAATAKWGARAELTEQIARSDAAISALEG